MSERSKAYYRTELLLSIIEKGLSEETSDKLTMMVRKAPVEEKENVAERLLKVVKESETEDEIVERLFMR